MYIEFESRKNIFKKNPFIVKVKQRRQTIRLHLKKLKE